MKGSIYRSVEAGDRIGKKNLLGKAPVNGATCIQFLVLLAQERALAH